MSVLASLVASIAFTHSHFESYREFPVRATATEIFDTLTDLMMIARGKVNEKETTNVCMALYCERFYLRQI
jgi:hypothetical protein